MTTRTTISHGTHRSFLAAFYSSEKPVAFNDPISRTLGFIDESNFHHVIPVTGWHVWVSEELKSFFLPNIDQDPRYEMKEVDGKKVYVIKDKSSVQLDD